MRHVLEHAHDPAAFLRAAARLVKPGGHLVLEMPDCTKFVQACDYSFIWEEHIAYFSTRTLAALIESAGLEMRENALYPYPLEDSLIAIVQNRKPANVRQPAPGEIGSALADGRTFAQRYSGLRARLHTLFAAWRKEGKRVALFGAGHLAAKFVNLLALRDYIDCVIDDNPHKQELLMPGSRLPIVGSAALEARSIAVCLLSLSPESEQKVRAKNQAYLDRGGRFLSIFPLSPQSVYAAATS
jgi:SAM-dependent methyltransferase